MCMYECTCACICWGVRSGFETLPHYLYGETLPGFLHLPNPVASPPKKHEYILYQEITFPCTFGKQGVLQEEESLNPFFHGTYRFLYPAPVPSAKSPTAFCVVTRTVSVCWWSGWQVRWLLSLCCNLFLCRAPNPGVPHLPDTVIKHACL